MVIVAQLVRVSDCESEGCGIVLRLSPKIRDNLIYHRFK